MTITGVEKAGVDVRPYSNLSYLTAYTNALFAHSGLPTLDKDEFRR